MGGADQRGLRIGMQGQSSVLMCFDIVHFWLLVEGFRKEQAKAGRQAASASFVVVVVLTGPRVQGVGDPVKGVGSRE